MKNKPQLGVFIIIGITIFIMAFSIAGKYYVQNKETLSQIETGVSTIDEHIEDNKGTENTDSNNEDTAQTPQQVKTYSSGYPCITDAFKLVSSEPGIKLTSEVTAKADIMGIGASTQRVTNIMIHSGDRFLKETWAWCDVSLGQNYYRYLYSENNLNSIEFRKTSSVNSDKTPNWGGTIVNITTSKNDICQNYDLICFDYFDFIPTKQNSKIVRFDRTSSKKYYIITFAFDLGSISERYTQNTMKEGGLSSLSYKSLTTTYYVEKSTTYIRKCENDLVYSMTKGITIDVTLHQDVYVNIIGQKINISKPSYC